MAKALGPGNSAEAENFFAPTLKNQVARMQPVLSREDFDLDGVEFIEADRWAVFGRQAELDDQSLAGEGIAAAGAGSNRQR